MNLLKSIYFIFIFFAAGIILSPAQSSVTINVQWTGSSVTVQIPNGSYITIPSAKNAFVNTSGTLMYQIDIPGKVTSLSETNIVFKASDSITTSILNKLTIAQSTTLTSAYLYNDVVSTRIYIPLLRQNGNGALERISSMTLSYAVTYMSSIAAAQTQKKSASNARTTSTGNSVLAQGSWYKMGVSESGMYRIDAAYLTSMGISPGSINPYTIQIFGNGGGMLPQPNDSSRINDLAEIATLIYDDGNNVFDANDYILFYAESPNIWQYNSDSLAIHPFSHQVDVYSNQNFYFLTFGQNIGKQISNQTAVSGATQIISTYNEHLYLEPDLYNIINSGRQWYGDQFDQFTPSRNYSFNITGATSTATLSISALARSSIQTSFQYNFNGNLGSRLVAPVSSNEDSPSGIAVFNNYTFNATGSSNLNVSITYSNGGSLSALGNLNYLEVNFMKSLQLYGTQTMFQSVSSLQSVSQYNIGNCLSTDFVWDITDPRNIVSQTTSLSGSTLQFSASSTSTLKEFIVFRGSAFPNPSFVNIVPNQNLHALATPDMVIVTYPAFVIQAQRLQAFRQANNGLNVEIVTTDQVFNEFSSGKQDVTAIRDFVGMLYNANTGSTQLKYLLLFGNGSYDYKNIQNLNSNFVPTYESRESLNPLESYNSDDYFAFLDPQEGAWLEGQFTTDLETMNIGVGRLNVRTPVEGDEIVSKIMSYSVNSSLNMGNWRNRLTLSACDGDNNTHLNNAELIYDTVSVYDVQLNINKIYIDAYPQETTPAGKIAPLVVEAINLDINEGDLIWNYVGHGGVGGLAQQGIVTDASINSWTNYNKLPFMITATCDFGRYDQPGLVSGAETALLSNTGGSCGMLTSTRTVYSNSNSTINAAFYRFVFVRNTDGTYPAIGNVMMHTKNASIASVYNRNYSLLADPSMIISFPKDKMAITAINNVPVSSVPDTLKALSPISLSGIVTDYNGNMLSNFTGQANIIVYDKPSIITTLGSPGNYVETFKLQNNFIFNGLASVTNGSFKVSFIVPKDISYNYDFGKISLYSQQTMGNTDAGGYFANVVVGGTNPHAPIDVTPPTIKLYLNDPSFVSGGVAGANPVFYAEVSDASGINVSTAGIGHEITLTMSNSSQVIVLNQYYTAALNDYTHGKVQYPLSNLAPGTYTLHFTVWDTYNNSAQQSLEFIVVNTSSLTLEHVLNYPNPFTTNTSFHFDHNRYGDDLQVQVQIYTVTGIMIKSLEENVYNSPSHISGLFWNGLDEFGSKIGHGVYVYKLKVRSLTDGSTAQVYEKLVLL